MRNAERFAEAFAHMEHVVMGRRLAKFTLRHRFWLEIMDSPLVRGGDVTLIDMEMASLVCAIPGSEVERRLPRLLSRGPSRWRRWRWWWRSLGRDAGKEYRLLQAYFADHGCPPAVWGETEVVVDGDDAGEGDRGPLPGVLGLVTGLMRGTGWEPDTVWCLGPGEAEWYLAGVFIHRGVDVGLKTGADEAMEEFLRKRDAAKAESLKS